jgi:hypothetical protein
MLLITLRVYSVRPHSVDRPFTMAVAVEPPFTTDTKIQFW